MEQLSLTISSCSALVGHTTIMAGSFGKDLLPSARFGSRDIERMTSMRKMKNPVFPVPVAIVATTSSPSKERQTPSNWY
jgi:hypothetical protein